MPILYNQPDVNSLAQSGFNYAQSKVYDLIEAQRAQLWQQTAVNATSNSIEKNKMDIESAKKLTESLRKKLLDLAGSPWPNSIGNAGTDNSNPIGFLSTKYISPIIDGEFNASNGRVDVVKGKLGQYEWKDWTGQKLSETKNILKTRDRFQAHKKLLSSNELLNDKYSLRDFLLIFGDTRTDYFKYGLQTIDNLTPIENPTNGNSTLRLDSFKGTPWEQSDPVYFGFDIVFDAVSSPLLNGSVLDFLSNYTSVSELSSKILIYDEFINQFTKFFRTNAKPVQSQQKDNIAMTKTRPHFTGHANSVSNFANLDENTPFFKPGKSAYFSNYIKKVSGIDLLVESNKGDTFKYLTDYRKDFITITTTEDVTLSMGTLAHLYKLLYWSKPNGKHLVPDNLLRFNCDIIVSEVRNMQRVRKNIQTGNLEVLKDNVSRWVFSLKECQFFFDKLPVENDIDLGAEPKQYEGFNITMDYKYSTHRLERFVPSGDWGQYVGYDAGSIWKIGNKGSGGATGSLTSNPQFVTVGGNPYGENGVNKPNTVNVYGESDGEIVTNSEIDSLKVNETNTQSVNIENSNNLNSLENTSNLKPGGSLSNAISEEQLSGAKEMEQTTIPKLNAPSPSVKKSNFFDKMGDITNTGKGTLDQLTSQFSKAKEQATSQFFDVRSNLTERGEEFLGKGKGTLDQLTSQFSKAKEQATSQFFDVRGNLTERGEEFLGKGKGTLDQLTSQFSKAKEQATSQFFDVRGNLTDKGEEFVGGVSNTQKKLFNETLNKVYNSPLKKTPNLKFNSPNSTSFFDIKGQLKDFLGGPLGDKLTD